MSKVIARHKWVSGATISESIIPGQPEGYRKFTATIRGFRNWLIWNGLVGPDTVNEVIHRVINFRNRIDAGDETIF